MFLLSFYDQLYGSFQNKSLIFYIFYIDPHYDFWMVVHATIYIINSTKYIQCQIFLAIKMALCF